MRKKKNMKTKIINQVDFLLTFGKDYEMETI